MLLTVESSMAAPRMGSSGSTTIRRMNRMRFISQTIAEPSWLVLTRTLHALLDTSPVTMSSWPLKVVSAVSLDFSGTAVEPMGFLICQMVITPSADAVANCCELMNAAAAAGHCSATLVTWKTHSAQLAECSSWMTHLDFAEIHPNGLIEEAEM
jgi:hypothetical protein